MSNLHSALQYAAIGWEIFPCWWVDKGACACGNPTCKSPGKHPIGAVVPGGQNNATTDEATIRAWFERYPKANIAVALATSGLCAVDVDPRNGGLTSFEAFEEQYGKITSDVMQFTGGGGQHYVFHAPKDAVLPGALGKGVDFKHNGYIMVEPSNHVQGDYAWEMSSDPREGIVPSPLPDWISALGRTPQQKIMEMSSGKRHIHIGVMAELQSALSHIPADDRDMWVRIGLALREGGQEGFTLWDQWSKKSDKYNPVDAYRTWHSFKPRGEIAYESVFFIAEEHGWVNPQRNTSIPLVEIPQAPAPEVDIQPLKIPEAQACPVDVVNRLADWVHSSSDQANSLVSQAVALSILCASAGRRYQSEHGDPAAVYFGVLAPSASYGRGAVALAERVMNEAGLKELVRSMRIGSPAQLLSTLYHTPALFYIAEDYGDQLRFSKRQSSGVLDQCLSLLGGKVWSSPSMFTLDNWAEVGMKRGEANEDRPTFRHPTVTMLALVSGNQVEQAFKRSELSRGALDSMLFIHAEQPEAWEARESGKSIPVDAACIEVIRAMRGFGVGQTAMTREQLFGKLAMSAPAMQSVRFTGDIQAAQMAISETYKHKGAVASALAVGARRNLSRLCVVLAASKDPFNPVADQPIVDWCVGLVRTMLDQTIATFARAGGLDDNELGRPTVYAHLESFIRERGKPGASKRDLALFGPRSYRGMKNDGRDELLARMLEDGAIFEIMKPGARKPAYVHADLMGVVQ